MADCKTSCAHIISIKALCIILQASVYRNHNKKRYILDYYMRVANK